MNKVLIPLAVKTSKNPLASTHFITEAYIRKLIKYNIQPVFISSVYSKNLINILYSTSEGILCVGGSDFDPQHYGQVAHPETKPGDPRRDQLEIYLIRKTFKDKKPFLGICRGCQALVVANHGTLHQHIPDIISQETHRPLKGGSYDDLVEGKISHKVIIDKHSKIYSLLKKEEIHVNTGHHQAVDNQGKNLVISGCSPKGIPEIIEHIDKNFFCFGIQSHPEAIDRGPLEVVFASFAKAVKRWARKK